MDARLFGRKRIEISRPVELFAVVPHDPRPILQIQAVKPRDPRRTIRAATTCGNKNPLEDCAVIVSDSRTTGLSVLEISRASLGSGALALYRFLPGYKSHGGAIIDA